MTFQLDLQKKIQYLQANYQVSTLAAKIIIANALSEEQIQELFVEEIDLDAKQIPFMNQILHRIHQAKEKNEKVLVCGDYDADGICATTILYDTLKRLGISCGYYIPNRLQEGYGLHSSTVEKAFEKGYQLIITVDNGVKAFAALDKAKELGMDCIVTDHHTYEEEVPCCIFLHPNQMPEEYQHLCGAAIAYQISCAFFDEIKYHTILACIASIGDMMPVWKQTRCIIKKGIRYLNEGNYPTLEHLRKNSSLPWDENEIAFQVVPKINSTGRLADYANANNTVKYLLLENEKEIETVCKQIIELNYKRKQMSMEMVEKAQSNMDEFSNFQVIFDKDFHEGLLGLAASKIVEQCHCPSVVFAQHNQLLKGSIRSYGTVDLRTFFQDCPIPLISYGGHKKAAGITIDLKDLDVFKKYVKEKTKNLEMVEDKASYLSLDMDEITIENIEALNLLKPFGEGFVLPKFYISNLKVNQIRLLSKGQHVKYECKKNIEVLVFHADPLLKAKQDVNKIDCIGNLSINCFQGNKKINILAEDVIF